MKQISVKCTCMHHRDESIAHSLQMKKIEQINLLPIEKLEWGFAFFSS